MKMPEDNLGVEQVTSHVRTRLQNVEGEFETTCSFHNMLPLKSALKVSLSLNDQLVF